MRPAALARALRTLLVATLLAAGGAARGEDCASFEIVGDRIPAPLDGIAGDARRGPEVALAADRGDCTICHRLPLPGRQFHGTVGPPLDRVGARLDTGQLRLRIAAPKRLHPNSLMPAYCTTGNRHRVALGFVGRPILSATEIEDLVAWLSTLDGTAAAPAATAPERSAAMTPEPER
ncbi:MAG TPA: hypothetical protein VLA56_04635 [Pseudomonadales bacterium]|nr:hypothetical protein [Pseudomonadales bacterium]